MHQFIQPPGTPLCMVRGGGGRMLKPDTNFYKDIVIMIVMAFVIWRWSLSNRRIMKPLKARQGQPVDIFGLASGMGRLSCAGALIIVGTAALLALLVLMAQ